MNIVVKSSVAEIAADPERFFREIEAGRVLRFDDVGYTLAPSFRIAMLDVDVDESSEAEDMVSLRTDKTGVDNTVFVSTKGYAQHAPRIKIAVDPPHTLNANSTTASMALHDYSTVGAYLPPHVVEQAKTFIERNRDALLAYWNHEIDTAELIKRLPPP